MYSRIEDPVDGVRVRFRDLVFSVGPASLYLRKEAVLILFGALLDLLALDRKVFLELRSVPAVVGSHYLVVPVVLDEILQVLAVCWSRIWHVMVGQPSF
jgi:hypothetical protein